jgi:CRP-like cAMP-binding protein
MVQPSPSETPRPIDRCLSFLSGGDTEAALRHAVPLAEADAKDPLPLFVIGASFAALDEGEAAAAALTAAARRAVRASNLPLAIAAAVKLEGKERAALLQEIAGAFGHGAKTLGDRRALPPSLPRAPGKFEPLAASLSGTELALRAREAVDAAAAEASEPIAEHTLLPQPLFSSLDADDFVEFASMFSTLVVETGTRLLEEGSVGAEAFIVARGELDVEKKAALEGGTPLHLARLGAGALIGEMALLLRSPRAATVIAVRPSVVLAGSKEALDQVAERSPVVAQRFAEHCKRRMLDNVVRTSPLFHAATPAERPALVERFNIRTFERGEFLARQGRPSEGLYLLGSGEVTILHRDGSDKTMVTRLGPGDVVGEVALVLRRPAIADAVAQAPTVTLFLPPERFLDLVRAHPIVFANLYQIAVARDVEIENISREETLEGEDFVLV